MSASIKEMVETAEKIVKQGGCVGLTCQECPSAYFNNASEAPCLSNEFYAGYSLPSNNDMSEGHLKAFTDFIAKHKGEKSAPKQSKPKDSKTRSVSVTWDGIEYTKDSIDGATLEQHASEMQDLIKQRDELNGEIRDYRTQANRHGKMDERGELD